MQRILDQCNRQLASFLKQHRVGEGCKQPVDQLAMLFVQLLPYLPFFHGKLKRIGIQAFFQARIS